MLIGVTYSPNSGSVRKQQELAHAVHRHARRGAEADRESSRCSRPSAARSSSPPILRTARSAALDRDGERQPKVAAVGEQRVLRADQLGADRVAARG